MDEGFGGSGLEPSSESEAPCARSTSDDGIGSTTAGSAVDARSPLMLGAVAEDPAEARGRESVCVTETEEPNDVGVDSGAAG